MDIAFAAACSLDGDVIRLVLIAEDHVEAAKEALFRCSPKLDTILGENESVQVTFHEMPAELAVALHLSRGQTQEWWLGERPQKMSTLLQ